MKISYNWLKEFINFSLTPEELAKKLTFLGLEVSGISVWDKTEFLAKVIVAEIKEIQPHPKADRLQVCAVNDGKDNYQIVCGAKNIQVGQRVPLALPGSVLPGSKKIEKTVLRGVESSGMLCSVVELELGKNSQGILILSPEAVLGEGLAKTLGLVKDYILELELTPNRGDCLSHLGVAREISALLNLPLAFPALNYDEVSETKKMEITIAESELCQRYIGRIIGQVTVNPSPIWLAERLESCGVRSLNNLVDITNYVLLELGQPLHAFDYQKIAGQKIVVRQAEQSEKIKALDGKEYELNKGSLVIADAQGPLALAGVIGGEESAVGQTTQTILLESGCFLPKIVRRSVQKLGIATESSYRFERGVDIENVETASRRAAYLYQQLAGGKVSNAKMDVYPTIRPARIIEISQTYLEKILGMSISRDWTVSLFERLGLKTAHLPDNEGKFWLAVTAPAYRNDLEQPCDLAEEIARLWGYDQIPTPPLRFTATTYPSDVFFDWEQQIREILVGLGFNETINYSLVPGEYLGEFLAVDQLTKTVKLANPLSNQGDTLRTSLISGLVTNLSFNIHRQNNDLKYFEIGRVFSRDGENVKEKRKLAFVLTGHSLPSHWQEKSKELDFHSLTGVTILLLNQLGLENIKVVSGKLNFLSPIENAQVVDFPEKVIGFAGRLHPKLEKKYDLSATYLAELDLELIFSSIEKKKKAYQPIPKYPAIKRDLSLVVPEKITVEEIINEIKKIAQELLKTVELFDLYQGKNIPEACRSLSFSLTYQHPERTLTESEINTLNEAVIASLETKFSAKMR
ncbi:MAG: phenylalanine--tRNA ligase subunit beta [Elusimicrobiota bacterium]